MPPDVSGSSNKVRIQSGVPPGIDGAAAVDEAKRRYEKLASTSRPGEEYAASFYVHDLRRLEELVSRLATDGHAVFDAVSMQFVLHYLVPTEQATRELLSALRKVLRPGGRVIATGLSSDALADLFSASRRSGSGASAKHTVGNALYNVCFSGEGLAQLRGCTDEELQDAFDQRWGLTYNFSLVDAVDDLEEYVVPWSAWEALLTEYGFEVVLDGTFPEVFKSYASMSKFYNNHFLAKKRIAGELNREEDELFQLCTAFVLQLTGT